MTLERDGARPSGRVLSLGGAWQSYLDLDDPTYLHFPYVQWMAAAVDAVLARPAPLHGVHLGGGGMTVPGWLAATRPGSTATVLEVDPQVVAEVAALVEVPGATVRVGDAREGLAAQPDGIADVVVTDAFVGRRVPEHLLDASCAADVVRVLRPGGLYLLNVIDDPPFPQLRAALETLRARFAHVGFVTIPPVLSARAGGNVVALASTAPLDLAALAVRCAPLQAVVADEAIIAQWCADVAALVG